MYFKILMLRQAGNMPSRCARRFIQRLLKYSDMAAALFVGILRRQSREKPVVPGIFCPLEDMFFCPALKAPFCHIKLRLFGPVLVQPHPLFGHELFGGQPCRKFFQNGR